MRIPGIASALEEQLSTKQLPRAGSHQRKVIMMQQELKNISVSVTVIALLLLFFFLIFSWRKALQMCTVMTLCESQLHLRRPLSGFS